MPVVGRIDLQPADYRWFELLDRHGYLSSLLLYRATQGTRLSWQVVQRRLTELTNGELRDPRPYLYRPEGQRNGHKAKTQHLVYSLTPRALAAIGARRCAVRPVMSASFPHQMMQSFAAFSFERFAQDHGLKYESRSEVLTSDRCGEAKGSNRPMAIPLVGERAGRLTPDDIFALVNAEGNKRFCLLEVDRATESMRPDALDRNLLGEKTTYFAQKLASYAALFASGQMKGWWGFNNPLVLILTTTSTRKRQIMEECATMPPKIAGQFWVKVHPEFGRMWHTSIDLMPELYEEPWDTVNGPRFLTKP